MSDLTFNVVQKHLAPFVEPETGSGADFWNIIFCLLGTPESRKLADVLFDNSHPTMAQHWAYGFMWLLSAKNILDNKYIIDGLNPWRKNGFYIEIKSPNTTDKLTARFIGDTHKVGPAVFTLGDLKGQNIYFNLRPTFLLLRALGAQTHTGNRMVHLEDIECFSNYHIKRNTLFILLFPYFIEGFKKIGIAS
jgi:hypothetical protein